MQKGYFVPAISFLATISVSCAALCPRIGDGDTVVFKESLIEFVVSIDEADSVLQTEAVAKLDIKNIYPENINIAVPETWKCDLSPTIKYADGEIIPQKAIVLLRCENVDSVWKKLQPGEDFQIEYPLDLHGTYYLDPRVEISVRFVYHGRICDSQMKLLSGKNDAIYSNKINLPINKGNS